MIIEHITAGSDPCGSAVTDERWLLHHSGWDGCREMHLCAHRQLHWRGDSWVNLG